MSEPVVDQSAQSAQSSSNSTATKRKSEWADTRKEERERRKRRDAQLKANNDADYLARKAAKAAKRQLQKRTDVVLRGRVVLDSQWDALMKPKDLVSLTLQLNRFYSANRLLSEPFRISLVGLADSPQLRERIDTKMAAMRTWTHFELCDASLLLRFAAERERLVYLTAESDTVLDKLADDDIYVVGALVDHNAHRGIVHRFATENKLRTARLPLAENIRLNSRKVLTVNCVCEILCQVRANGGDWKAAIELMMPARKVASKADQPQPQADDQDDEEDDDEEQ